MLVSILMHSPSCMALYCTCCLCFHQVCAFLDKLGELRSLQPLAPSMCRKMNELYDLDASQNYEVGGVLFCRCVVLCYAVESCGVAQEVQPHHHVCAVKIPFVAHGSED